MRISGILVRVVLAATLVSCASTDPLCPSGLNRPASADVRPLAMMFQVVTQFRCFVATRDLSSIHNEDPIISAAVNEFLSRPDDVPTNEVDLFKQDLTTLSQDVSALHDAGDMLQQAQAEAALGKVNKAFKKVQGYFPAKTIASARELADVYTCPMHPEVTGRKGELCPKCGMALDQMVRIVPPRTDAQVAAGIAIHASVRTEGPLTVGQPCTAILTLSQPDGYPVCLPDLIETHTKKIHLLIVDSSLIDYQHEHPEPTDKLGEYVFHFTPHEPGGYRVWADLRPTPLGLQQYAMADIPAPTAGLPLTDKSICYKTNVEGLTYELFLDGDTVKVGKPMHARLRITDASGRGFTQLEPIMATFAHIVGFNEDFHTIMHIHPRGAPVLNPKARGGPDLDFQIYALQPGFVRLFAQVQIGGVSKYAPFGIQVVP